MMRVSRLAQTGMGGLRDAASMVLRIRVVLEVVCCNLRTGRTSGKWIIWMVTIGSMNNQQQPLTFPATLKP